MFVGRKKNLSNSWSRKANARPDIEFGGKEYAVRLSVGKGPWHPNRLLVGKEILV